MNMISKVVADGEAKRLRLKLANARSGNALRLSERPWSPLAAAVTLWSSDPSPAAAPPTPQVTVAAPLEQSVSLWDDYVGRFEASRTVEVRPRVSGQIVGIHFTDGAIVQKGQLLFTVDPRPFAASLAEARAGVATARSELALADTNLGRARRLLEADAVSQANVDQLSAQVQTARAALAAAQARVQQRALDVEFTRIRAPISGRISDRRIDAGNLVSAGVDGGTLLTTINALDPIYFTFDVPESLYLKDSRERACRRAGRRRRDPAAGRGDLQPPRPARLHRQWHQPEFGNDPRPRRRRQSRPVPDARHVRQHAARRRRDDAGPAGPRRSDPHRPGPQDRADGRQGRHRRRQAGRNGTVGRRPARHPLRPDRAPTRWSSRASSSPCPAPRCRPRVDAGPRCQRRRRQGSAAIHPQAPHRRPWPLAKRRTPMQFSHFFIRRPIFAGVIAIIITIVGAFAYIGLPVSQFPDIVPPTVTVSANYPGASAETVADTVAAPIEQQINGVDNMLYQSSQSTGDGRVTITVTFKLGTDLDTAQVLVQNRVALAQPSLPEEVRRQGVVVRKTSPSWLMAVNVLSPDGSLDRGYVSNYALTQLKDRLSRVEGIGDVPIFGARDYAMRVWIDPGRASTLGLTAGEIVQALRSQNVQVAAGTVGQPPFNTGAAQQLNVETQGRFKTADEFANIIIRTDPTGAITRLRDVARVELGAEDYGVNAYLSGKDSRDPRHHPAAGHQRARRRRRHQGASWPTRPRLPQGPRISDHLEPDRIHQRIDERGAGDAARGDDPRRPRHHRLPAELARGDHPDRRHPGLADRHLRGARGARLFAQHPVDVRPGAGDRHRRRRRDRRGRECRAQPRAGPQPARGRAPFDGRGVDRAGRDRPGALRGVRARHLPHRHHGRILSPVRGHDRGLDDHLAAPVADPVAGARRPAAASRRASIAPKPASWASSIAAGDRFNAAFDRLSEWYGRFTRRLLDAPKRALTDLCAASSA